MRFTWWAYLIKFFPLTPPVRVVNLVAVEDSSSNLARFYCIVIQCSSVFAVQGSLIWGDMVSRSESSYYKEKWTSRYENA